MSDVSSTALTLHLSAAQLAMIDAFRARRGQNAPGNELETSRETAAILLLDIALEATSGTGRRYWDRRIAPAADAPVEQARTLGQRLQSEGHVDAAARLHDATLGERVGAGLLDALREACQFALTTVEALDPKTQLMAEELRLELDKRLGR